MRLRDLTLVLMIAAFLIGGEALLEARAHRRGFDTLAASIVQGPSSRDSDSVPRWGPTPDFPFASERTAESLQPDPDALVVWVSSSSYALGGASSFPRFAQDSLRALGFAGAVVLAEATAGRSMSENMAVLRDEAARWKPDVVVLYQLTNELHAFAVPGVADASGVASNAGEGLFGDALPRLYERTTLYAQLSANFTPWFSQHQLTPSALPASADTLFAQLVRGFIETARNVGARPVLTTLATSHRLGDVVPRDRRFWMLKWNPYYQPDAYLRTVERWNRIIRDAGLGAEVAVLDAAELLAGKPELFVDLVHLTDGGKRVLGGALADEIARVRRPAETVGP